MMSTRNTTTTMRFRSVVKKQDGVWVKHVYDTKNNDLPCFSAWGMPGERCQPFCDRAERSWDDARKALLAWENR